MSAPGSLPEALKGCRVDGRVALVTGAGRGLGLAAAIGLAQAGAEVHLVSRTRAELEKAADTIRSEGGIAQALVCDVTNGRQVREAFARLPRLDILINNAGGNMPEPFVEVTEERLDRILNLNVRAAFLVAQAAARKMLEVSDRRERGGAMVNISSQMGHVGAAGRTVYCMTKHALEGLTKALGVELAPHNIRVNSIAPTFIETPMTAPFFEEPRFREWVLNRIPLGRLGQLDEVTAAVVFLASPAASLITGASLVVDGGWTAQ
ncbi:MAG: 3-oxoacyl-ACP reductase [Betaproteobacteria bacterium SG8_41]|jgi:NAD(P)-dependent dehydrogenase (short-subunit alcohol dehydrogenase family)|nr:MAG: 3-oxoacyl-ACP reductase [Betaproteobacteria bacterium SG8_41]